MAQTSTTLIGQVSMAAAISGATISYNATNKRISDSNNGFGNIAVNDIVTVSGSALNNGTYTVTAITTDGSYIEVSEAISTEAADGSTTHTVTQTGLVSTKVAGDGYYSKPDGVHTVSYRITNTVPATADIRMQGTLATTPTENDWFDITTSSITPDLSTTIFYNNFTGNFVWVRLKATGITAGGFTEVLYNN